MVPQPAKLQIVYQARAPHGMVFSRIREPGVGCQDHQPDEHGDCHVDQAAVLNL